MQEIKSLGEFDAALSMLQGGHPNAEEYQRLTTLVVDHPKAHALGKLDPFSSEYRSAALDLYATLRSRDEDRIYVAERDEASESGGTLPSNIWTGLVPWSFRSPALSSEFLMSWGHIFQLINVKANHSVLEYGPGSGQILLMLARMGITVHGVDIDQTGLDGIRAQADLLGVPVALERGVFGEGFQDQQFDTILFFEAFHHSLDFQSLLHRLRDRIKPGGQVILCGEPIVEETMPGIPYPWGPRLDALSVYCIRKWGWMELGFTRSFLTEAARRAGWDMKHHPFNGCNRASAFVLTLSDKSSPPDQIDTTKVQQTGPSRKSADECWLELTAMRQSTSWRITSPLRTTGSFMKRILKKNYRGAST